MLHEIINLYPDRTDVTLTTYVNDFPKEMTTIKSRPAVLICPGGAYLMCAPNEGDPVAANFYAKGYQAFVLKYSVYNEGQPDFPDLKKITGPKEHCIFPKPMYDIKAAMECILTHAEEWQVDPDEIFLCGFSAGGHNAGMYSVSWKKEGMPKPCGTILGYPVADYYDQKFDSNFAKAMFTACNTVMVGHAEMTEEDLHRTSIIENIDEFTPPMFLWNTATDEMVDPTQTLRLAQALVEHKIPVEVHMFESGRHSLSVANASSAITEKDIRPDLQPWTDLAETWMQKLVTWTWS